MLRFVAAVVAAWLVFAGMVYGSALLPVPASLAFALTFSLPLVAFLSVTLYWRRFVR